MSNEPWHGQIQERQPDGTWGPPAVSGPAQPLPDLSGPPLEESPAEVLKVKPEDLDPRTHGVVPQERGPLAEKIPRIPQPPKEKPKPAAAKPKPTQIELLTDEVTADYSRLINYLKKAEGTSKQQAEVGSFKGGKFQIYDDVGEPAIGYGHRLTPEEKESGAYNKGINDKKATELLMQDIRKAEIGAMKHFGKKGWAAMDQHQREMAIDFVYNLGASSFAQFKTFSRHLRMGNIKGIKKSYKRHYSPKPGAAKVPLKPRNDLFYKTFIYPLETEEIILGQEREPTR